MSTSRDGLVLDRRAFLTWMALALPTLVVLPLPATRANAAASSSSRTIRPAERAALGMAGRPGDDPYRLPRTVVPERYQLTISPDLAAGTFAGEETIAVRVLEPVAEVVLNALGLDIEAAYLTDAAGVRLDGIVTLEPETERARIGFGRTLEPGPWQLSLRFGGRFADSLHGFYLSTATDDNGVEQVMAATQLQSTYARQVFPCWDEPDLKAVFGVTLVVEAGLAAISNGRVLDETPLADGKVAVRFADTIAMSTYLIALFAGSLDVTDPVVVDGVPMRIAYLRGRPPLVDFPLEVGAFALRFFRDYYGIPYPGDKLDSVAVPDFALGGMENFGAIAYDESALLVDGASAAQRDLLRTAFIVCHEISHQWFGDLVTMRWWNGLWLNEAFATMMENLAADAFRPEWEVWVSFGVDRDGAMATDALATTRPIEFPVRAPAEAESMFDVITYQKGGAVLRMLEQYLGPEPFRRGVAEYLRTHSYGNAETTDLWDAIERATGQPTRQLMDSWVFQPGFPIVSVEADADRQRLTLSQRRFRYLPDPTAAESRWQIPIILRLAGPGGTEERRILLDRESTTIELLPGYERVVANAGGHGFYRVRYAPDLLRALTANLQQDLGTIERLNLVQDTWAAVVAGLTPVAEFIDLARLFGDETNHDIWASVLDPFGLLIQLLDPRQRPVAQAFVRELVGPAVERVGWEPAPGEDEVTGRLRSRLVHRLAVVGKDPGALAKALELHAAYLRDRTAVDANLMSNVVYMAAHASGPEAYDVFLEQYRTAPTPQERNWYMYALTFFQDPSSVQRTLELTLTDEIRPGNAPFVITELLLHETHRDLAWTFVKEHWETILERFDGINVVDMLSGITALWRPESAADVERFFAAHPLEIGAQTLAQHLERLRINVAFTQRAAPELATYFQAHR